MIGTIKPSWSQLKDLGHHQEVKNCMCRTCGALGSKNIFSRSFLSFDTIFLSLFSQEEQFREGKLRFRPMQCLLKNKFPSIDGNYLANISVVTAATKIEDDIQDGKACFFTRFRNRIRRENDDVLLALNQNNFPVESLQNALLQYSKSEQLRESKRTFDEISQPIADAYLLVFSHLPSRKNDEKTMSEIGKDFGRLTLLVDAINDANEDMQTGNFNAWQMCCDIPQELEAVKPCVVDLFNSLLEKSSRLSNTAASYVKSAKENIISRLGQPKIKPSGLASLMLPFLFAESEPLFHTEENCDGTTTTTMTPTGETCMGCCLFSAIIYCLCKKK
ncbi:MAG: DUF5685 family protein [Planctomycetaceae bacterium]|jgi:hypothetical protein|nr:DUF5685 family protein [Planctomycetaceae bacterium]